jgi:tetratricopeptide (TPR) repeat protein
MLTVAVLSTAEHVPSARQQAITKPARYVEGLMQWIEDHYGITRAYHRGEIQTAFSQLSQWTTAEQRQVAERILGVLEVRTKNVQRPTPGSQADPSQRRAGVAFSDPDQTRRAEGFPPTGDRPGARFDWTVDILPVAGSLHMDAALQAYRRSDAASPQEVSDQIKIADAYFGFYERQTGKPTDSSRWQLAIGLTAMADGRFGVAASVLDDACTRFVRDRPLQLACGSIRETIAMLPAGLLAQIRSPRTPFQDNPLTEFDESTARRRSPSNGLADARAARESYLKHAAQALEIALSSDANDAEARLRLAHVRSLQGNDRGAAELLERLIARSSDPPVRIAYLSRLYLADLRARQRQAAAATTLLEEAITLVPSGRSAYLALAKLARAEGKTDESATAVHRMLLAPTAPPDPWVGYRFGQFWLPDGLIAELRRRAQQE